MSVAAALLRPARSALPAAQRTVAARSGRWVSSSAPKAYATHTESSVDTAGDRIPAAAKPLMKEFKIYRWVSISATILGTSGALRECY